MSWGLISSFPNPTQLLSTALQLLWTTRICSISFPMPSFTWSVPCIDQNYLSLGKKNPANWSELGASYMECKKKKKKKSFCYSDSLMLQTAPFEQGSTLCHRTWLKSVVSERFMKTWATHSCSSTMPCRPNGSLCAFGHITRIPCHNPSALSLPMFSMPALPHLPSLPPSPEIQVCQIWIDFGESTGSSSVKAASISELQITNLQISSKTEQLLLIGHSLTVSL